jgi:selenocysteine lyase/cysteine desulfurase
VERVARDVGALTARIADAATALGYVAPAERDRVRHMVGLTLPGGLPATLADRLTAERVHVSIRGNSIRVAPHLYNDERDVVRFLEVLERR